MGYKKKYWNKLAKTITNFFAYDENENYTFLWNHKAPET